MRLFSDFVAADAECSQPAIKKEQPKERPLHFKYYQNEGEDENSMTDDLKEAKKMGVPKTKTFRRCDAVANGCVPAGSHLVVVRSASGNPSLQQAVELGYTEPDCRDDLSGEDVQRKAVILARVLGALAPARARAVGGGGAQRGSQEPEHKTPP